MRVNGLIPARFLVLISHIVITVTIFISRDLHIKASLPTSYTTAEYNSADINFIIVLAVSCFLFAFELLSFLFGVTMFLPTQSLFSTASHFAGSVALLLFVLDSWPVNDFFYVFGFCIALPAVTELIAIISAFSYTPKTAEAPTKSSSKPAASGTKAS